MYNFFSSPSKKKQYALLIVDILIILVTIGFSYIIRFFIHHESISIDNFLVRLDIRHTLLVIVYIFSLYIFSQYNLNHISDTWHSSKTLLMALTVGVFAVSSVFFFFPKYIFGRTALISHYILLIIFIDLWRYVFVKYILKKGGVQKVLLLGDKEQVKRFSNEIGSIHNSGYQIVGAYCNEDAGFCSMTETNQGAIHENISSVLAKETYDILAYDTKCQHFKRDEIEIILQAKYQGKTIYDFPTFYQDVVGKAPIEFIDNTWLLFNARLQGREKQYYIRVKRLFDIILAISLLVLSFPLIIIIAAAIKLTSKGPIFFIQERLCAQHNTFKCYKFRTMTTDDGKEKSPAWATSEGHRITRLGRFLRKLQLDEIPQLWNILKGEMSFVGPRPIRKQFADELSKEIPFYNMRFMVKPGLSGWAQVNMSYADSIESQLEKFKYELFYLQNLSFFIDIIVIIKTIQKVIRGEGK